jgi:hypothetical protein
LIREPSNESAGALDRRERLAQTFLAIKLSGIYLALPLNAPRFAFSV